MPGLIATAINAAAANGGRTRTKLEPLAELHIAMQAQTGDLVAALSAADRHLGRERHDERFLGATELRLSRRRRLGRHGFVRRHGREFLAETDGRPDPSPTARLAKILEGAAPGPARR